MTFVKQRLRMPAVNDFFASIVVFLVALPLCMGIAIASGMPPESGIVTGVVGGMVVSLLGGCQLQVSGPAAGLAVLVAELLAKFGLEKLAMIIALAGMIQLAAGVIGMAQWFRAVPPSVINGMLSGIGVLIFASQFHVMVDDGPKHSGLQNLLSIPESIYKGITPAAGTTHEEAAVIGIITILVLLCWDRFVPKKLKSIPGSLVAIILAASITAGFNLPIKMVHLPSNLLTATHGFNWAGILSDLHTDILWNAVAVAFIASAETLLTATALDKMHRGVRTNYDRELSAQGVGNIICGMLGSLPMTGVMVRSGVNLAAGAKTRWSSFFHGMWLLAFVCLLPWLVERIPLSSLAALLVFTGYKLANFKIIKELKRFGRSELAIYGVTVTLIVTTDLLTGVIAGVVMALGKLIYIFSHLEIFVTTDESAKRTDITLKGAATFLSLPKLADILDSVPGNTELHIHLEALEHIDHACLDLLMSWDKSHQSSGGNLVMDWDTLGMVFRDRRRNTREGAVKQFRKMPAEQPAPSTTDDTDLGVTVATGDSK